MLQTKKGNNQKQRSRDCTTETTVVETAAMMTHLHAGLSSETMEKARLELNENPDTLHQDIQQVRCTSAC